MPREAEYPSNGICDQTVCLALMDIADKQRDAGQLWVTKFVGLTKRNVAFFAFELHCKYHTESLTNHVTMKTTICA